MKSVHSAPLPQSRLEVHSDAKRTPIQENPGTNCGSEVPGGPTHDGLQKRGRSAGKM